MQFDQIKRREFITLIGGAAAAWPLAARAQQFDRMRRIGVLTSLAAGDPVALREITALQQGLQDLGWTDGRNLQIEYRWAAGDIDRMRTFAKELIGLRSEVIVARATPATVALARETRTIPTVFAQVSDPVGDGLVSSLARPSGNVTGFTNVESSMSAKWLQLLKEIVPSVARATCIFNPSTAPSGGSFFLGPFEAAASSLGVEAITTLVQSASDIERAFGAAAREPGGGLIVMPDTFVASHRALVVGLAVRHRLPVVYPFTFWVPAGGLIAYGSDSSDLFRRAAAYVDRILKGAKPADLPVQAPVKFELSINLKTATALGLEVPPMLLGRADEVIE